MKLLRNNCEWLLKVIMSITVVSEEISVQVNNVIVLSNDVTLTERKLKCKLFSTVSTYVFPLHYTISSMYEEKEVNRGN